MKYVAFWTIPPENMEEAIELYFKLNTLKPGQGIRARFPKVLSENYGFCGQNQGFQLFEVDNPDQMTAVAAYYGPCVQFEFVPIDVVENAAKVIMEIRKK